MNLNKIIKKTGAYLPDINMNKSENDIFSSMKKNTKSIICKDSITNDEIELESFLENSFSKMLYNLNNPDDKDFM